MASLSNIAPQKLNNAATVLRRKSVEIKHESGLLDIIVFEKKNIKAYLGDFTVIENKNPTNLQQTLDTVSKSIDLNSLYKDLFFSNNLYSSEEYSILKTCIFNLNNHIENPYHADSTPPSKNVIAQSIKLLDIVFPKGISPTRISASIEGSVIWEFIRNDKYYLVEIHNDGDVVYLRREHDKRIALDLNFETLIEQIIELLNE